MNWTTIEKYTATNDNPYITGLWLGTNANIIWRALTCIRAPIYSYIGQWFHSQKQEKLYKSLEKILAHHIIKVANT